MAYFLKELSGHVRDQYRKMDEPRRPLFIASVVGYATVAAVVRRPDEGGPVISLFVMPDHHQSPKNPHAKEFTYSASDYGWTDGKLVLQKRGMPTVVLPTEDTPGRYGQFTMPGETGTETLDLVIPRPDPMMFESSQAYARHHELGRAVVIGRADGETDLLPTIPGDMAGLIGCLIRPE